MPPEGKPVKPNELSCTQALSFAAVTVTTGKALTVIVVDDVAEQPLASVNE